MNTLLQQQRTHLAQLLEATQRSVYFLDGSLQKISWPVNNSYLTEHRKNITLFETLAAINERFAKLQDTLAATMRHTALLLGERHQNFLNTLTFFEKIGVLDNVPLWQQSRLVRNIAAHDYDLEYDTIADHFNTLHSLTPMLLRTAGALFNYIEATLDITPESQLFATEFSLITTRL